MFRTPAERRLQSRPTESHPGAFAKLRGSAASWALAWMAWFGIVVQVLALCAAGGQASARDAASVVWNGAPICHAAASDTVPDGDRGQHPSNDHGGLCRFCLGGLTLAGAPPTPILLPVRDAIAIAVAFIGRRAVTLPSLHALHAPARAPPLRS